jgi:hypothetical protein
MVEAEEHVGMPLIVAKDESTNCIHYSARRSYCLKEWK